MTWYFLTFIQVSFKFPFSNSINFITGFIEYILDRSIDNTKDEKEAKYEIIKKLTNSPAFDCNVIARLKTYVEQGPFFSESTLQIAMEEGD